MNTIKITAAAKVLGICRTKMDGLVRGGYFDIFQATPGSERLIILESFESFQKKKITKATAYGKAEALKK